MFQTSGGNSSNKRILKVREELSQLLKQQEAKQRLTY